MKCKYCNAEVAPNVRYCTTCGGDLSKFDKCVNCGEFIDKGASSCPHCGAEQPHKEIGGVKRNGTKKWLLILPLMLLLVGAGVRCFFSGGFSFGSKVENAMVEAVDSDSIIAPDIHSVEGIKARMTKILNEGMAMPDAAAVKKFFSKDYQETYFKVDEYDKQNIPEGEIGFWDFSMWGDGQGGLGNFHSNVFDVQNIKESSALVIVEYVSDEIEGAKMITNFHLVFEDGNWLINEVTDENALRYKETMKEYVNRNALGNTTISNGRYSMAGKVSKYPIHMSIEIDGSEVNGYYYYDSQGSGNRVKLSGVIGKDGELTLKKFSNEGKETGYFEGIFNGIEYRGKNVNYNRDENLQFSVSVE